MSTNSGVNLVSERLRYEPIHRSHASEFERILCDPLVYRFIEGACPTPADLLSSFTRKEMGAPSERSDERWLDYAVRLGGSGLAIGRIEATILEKRAEVAYLFGTDFWGHGYATEGIRWLHALINTTLDIQEFWATVMPNNTRSMRLLERLGYLEAPAETWPRLTSYDPGDRVFYYIESSNRDLQTTSLRSVSEIGR
jgi:RimJ/RimL family protein N-acetyltransferase